MWPVSNCLRTIIYLCPRPSDRVSLQKKKYILFIRIVVVTLPWKCKLTSKWSPSFPDSTRRKFWNLLWKRNLVIDSAPLQNIVIFLCLADKFSVSLRQLRQTIYPILPVFPDFGPLSLSSARLLRSEKKSRTDFSSFLALWRQTAESSKTNSSFSKWILDGLKQR